MEEFYRDILSFGCLRVFRHFTTYLRGREELLIIVRNHDLKSGRTRSTLLENRVPPSSALPPASPSSSETKRVSSSETLFLLGAYGRYAGPYVWLRSSLQGCSPDFNKDRPVELRSVRDWKRKGTKVWDIVEELVMLKASPSVENPFEVDFTELSKLQPLEKATMAGATAAFLQKLLLDREFKYAELLKHDLHKLLVCHFQHMASVLPAKMVGL